MLTKKLKEKQIVAIGGGGWGSNSQDHHIKEYLLALTKKNNPKVCFLPQASSEDRDYIVSFYDTFTKSQAIPSWISLFGRVENTWKSHLLEQDLIYVGGGNTRSMLALWREWGMDVVLKQAYEQGIILCGVSAGAICWFEHCVTDSVWPLGALQGLHFLAGSCCPHFDSELERKPAFLRMVKNQEIKPGIALEDNVAAHYIDGKLYKIISDLPNKKAYFVSENDLNSLEVDYV